MSDRAQELHIDPYEKRWIYASLVLLAAFLLAVAVSSFAFGIQLPGVERRVDPYTVTEEGPFAEPGVRELAPGKYEVYMVAQIWTFVPNEIRVPAGSTVTFYITSKDVQHGFKIEDTNVNMMVLPGQVSVLTARFDKPGEYLFFCHEYCGIGHHTMYGKIIVEAP